MGRKNRRVHKKVSTSMFVIMACLVAPLIEEVGFRLPLLLWVFDYSTTVAIIGIIVSSILFGFAHLFQNLIPVLRILIVYDRFTRIYFEKIKKQQGTLQQAQWKVFTDIVRLLTGGVFQVCITTVLGCLCATALYYTRNFLFPVIIHMLWNSTVIFLFLVGFPYLKKRFASKQKSSL